MEGDAEAFTPPLTQSSPAEVVSAKRCKKKKKKRKHESDDGEELKERECVQSHLDTSNQEEDWCQSGVWSLTSHSDAESKQKAQVSATSTTQRESRQNEQEQGSVKKKKKKRKKKKRIELQEALQDMNSTCSTSERNSEPQSTDACNDTQDSIKIENRLTVKKKKKKKLKEELRLLKESQPSDDSPAEEPPFNKTTSDSGKVGKQSTPPAVMWDSQVKDGYKRCKARAANGTVSVEASKAAPSAAWDGKRSSDVVDELLKNSTDKAYGASVLSWDGEVSAVSKDAIEDVRSVMRGTVIDEWDEDFDRGKVKKMKNYKREKWRTSSNFFQKVQDHWNKWSVLPGGKRVFGVRR